jgi:hypothetical protein
MNSYLRYLDRPMKTIISLTLVACASPAFAGISSAFFVPFGSLELQIPSTELGAPLVIRSRVIDSTQEWGTQQQAEFSIIADQTCP